MAKFSGRVVVITGGGSGVGMAAAGLFLRENAKVVIAGRDANKLEHTVTELGAGNNVLAIPTDVTNPESCQQLIARSRERFGPVDILVNNAGMNVKERTMRDLTPDAWDRMIRTNLDGAFYCTKAVLSQMLARKDGVIINVVSIAGLRANPLGGAAYVAAKHGLGALGYVLANEERESGIRVSNIYPGEIDTPILDHRPKPVSEEQRAVILKPEDVADAILYVAGLPSRVSVPELIIKPTVHPYF